MALVGLAVGELGGAGVDVLGVGAGVGVTGVGRDRDAPSHPNAPPNARNTPTALKRQKEKVCVLLFDFLLRCWRRSSPICMVCVSHSAVYI